jgi:hypothetical protein
MSAAVEIQAPPKLEKKPVKFSNLLRKLSQSRRVGGC